tara:strand:- start:20 stop:745 length:726 start_codon:yes stop_codon:yes gene_type:complete
MTIFLSISLYYFNKHPDIFVPTVGAMFMRFVDTPVDIVKSYVDEMEQNNPPFHIQLECCPTGQSGNNKWVSISTIKQEVVSQGRMYQFRISPTHYKDLDAIMSEWTNPHNPPYDTTINKYFPGSVPINLDVLKSMIVPWETTTAPVICEKMIRCVECDNHIFFKTCNTHVVKLIKTIGKGEDINVIISKYITDIVKCEDFFIDKEGGAKKCPLKSKLDTAYYTLSPLAEYIIMEACLTGDT